MPLIELSSRELTHLLLALRGQQEALRKADTGEALADTHDDLLMVEHLLRKLKAAQTA